MDVNKLSNLTVETLRTSRLKELEKFRKIDSGLIPHRYFKKPVTSKILMLVDTGISYSHYYFGLSEVLNTLYTNPEWWVKFEVTRAHRFTDPVQQPAGSEEAELYAPHFQNFRFNQAGFDINEYDQLWLFGLSSSSTFPQALDEDELEIVYRWMNEKQGGVLAMGDHEELGAALCSEIPRVRNMRKWRGDVPPISGNERHDTLFKGHDDPDTSGIDEGTIYTFDDESDDIPMRVTLRRYYSHLCTSLFKPKNLLWQLWKKRYVHPLMCGKSGPINILPDHPHEGEVVVPTDLNDILTFNVYSAEEYPKIGTRRLKPEIVAWAHVQGDHTAQSDINKGEADADTFGAVGAYNGHCADVGRVAVDSTWHHWFDVNLNGRLQFGSSDPANVSDERKLSGFNTSDAGKAAYARIKNYYRNVAIWLNPPKKIRSMACVALWNGLYRYPLLADLDERMEVWELGKHVISVLKHYAGECQVRGWWTVFVPHKKLERLFNDRLSKLPSSSLENIDEFMIGGIVKSMLTLKNSFLEERRDIPDDRELDDLVQKGIKTGIESMLAYMGTVSRTEANLRKTLKDML